jgi:limonene-1,2-epoxide hydrolase
MPWFPDFISAAELARKQTRAAGSADPVGHYLAALTTGDAKTLETVWPGELIVHDPRAGQVQGHKQLQQFMRRNQSWLAARKARVDTIASTTVPGRAVVELLAHLVDDGLTVEWPVAVVAECVDDRSVTFRTYCSQWPVDGRRPVRPSILPTQPAHPPDVVHRYQVALEAGDIDAAVGTFAPDGYYREPIGPQSTHRGPAELRSFFTNQLGAGGIRLEPCAVTDDGVRCALEYNCVHADPQHVPPQAGIGVFERNDDGLLAAARIYDDVQPPRHRSAADATDASNHLLLRPFH